jgi:hypothetical protein
VTWIDVSVAVSIHKCLEDGDGIFNPLEGRIQRESAAELFPDGPVRGSGICAGRNHSALDLFLCTAEVTAEIMGSSRVHNCHGHDCG